MVRAFHSKGTLVEYWTIDVAQEYWAIHSGPRGTVGEWQVQEFLDAETAEASAEELIAAKLRSGYVADPRHDPQAQLYLDDPEFGAHILTSHPAFNEHFADEMYLDVVDEDGPFGNTTGADTLTALEEGYTGRNRPDAATFAEHQIREVWEMEFHDPSDAEADLAGYRDPGGAATTDQAVIAVALGTVKITGRLPQVLQTQALASLDRRLRAGTVDGDPDEAAAQMVTDLRSFPTTD